MGQFHGTQAKLEISRTIAFYATQFRESAKLAWPGVRIHALRYKDFLQDKFPDYLEEISGIAAGAGVPESDILAINVRTEITFGLFSDGCTALSWQTSQASWLAQNWDWMSAQRENLILLTLEPEGKPRIKMVTEAGLIGKIGMNEAGVGVCLNAIRMRGSNVKRLPCHLGLRLVLESGSRQEAVGRLEECGIASACHMLVADPTGSVGLEWSSDGLDKLAANAEGQIFHTNHYLPKNPGEPFRGGDWLGDSVFRMGRVEELARSIRPSGGHVSKDEISKLFEDEANYPGSICRAESGTKSTSATLFSIVMDLKSKRATIKVGRPTEPEETIEIGF